MTGSVVDVDDEPEEDSPEADPVAPVWSVKDWLTGEDARDSLGVADADDPCDVFVTSFSTLPTELDDGVREEVLSEFVVLLVLPVLIWVSCDMDDAI